MRRPSNWLSVLGLLAIAVRLVWAGAPGRLQLWLVLGIGLVLAHVLLRWEDVVRVVVRRPVAYGTNAVFLALVVLAILGVVNWVANRYTVRWDLTKGQRFSLSEQSRKIVAALEGEVKITYFQIEEELQLAQHQPTRDRLTEYKEGSSHVKVEYVDPMRKPEKARGYQITTLPAVVVEYAGSRERVSNDSEQDITNAIVRVTRGKKTVCFVEGEGERDPDDGSERGYSFVKTALSKSHYEVKKVLLLGLEKVPDDCSVLVVAGPRKDPLPPVLDRLRGHVAAGGKAMVLIEPDIDEAYPGLVKLVEEWNIQAGSGVVVDQFGDASGLGVFAAMGSVYRYHDITKDFQLPSAFFLARPVQAGSAPGAAATAQNLVETYPQAELQGQVVTWVETDFDQERPGYDDGRDRKGPVSLAAVATVRSPEPEPAPSPSPDPVASPGVGSPAPSPAPGEKPDEPDAKRPEGRVVVVGDADFASNAVVRRAPGNFDLFMNAVAWLSQDTDLISVRPAEPDDHRMFLSAVERRVVSLTALAVIPGLFVVVGLAAWWRRR